MDTPPAPGIWSCPRAPGELPCSKRSQPFSGWLAAGHGMRMGTGQFPSRGFEMQQGLLIPSTNVQRSLGRALFFLVVIPAIISSTSVPDLHLLFFLSFCVWLWWWCHCFVSYLGFLFAFIKKIYCNLYHLTISRDFSSSPKWILYSLNSNSPFPSSP
jgi:hypothetical protein